MDVSVPSFGLAAGAVEEDGKRDLRCLQAEDVQVGEVRIRENAHRLMVGRTLFGACRDIAVDQIERGVGAGEQPWTALHPHAAQEVAPAAEVGIPPHAPVDEPGVDDAVEAEADQRVDRVAPPQIGAVHMRHVEGARRVALAPRRRSHEVDRPARRDALKVDDRLPIARAVAAQMDHVGSRIGAQNGGSIAIPLPRKVRLLTRRRRVSEI